MQLVSFGKTWWGSAWLDALEKAEQDKEKLEEAKNIALRGNIAAITIEPGLVKAKLDLGEGKACDIVIKIPESDEASKKSDPNGSRGKSGNSIISEPWHFA